MHHARTVLALFSASMLAASPLVFAGGWGHRPSDPSPATVSAGALSLAGAESASRASASQIIGGLDWICPRCRSASFVFSFPVLRGLENKSDVPLDAHHEKD